LCGLDQPGTWGTASAHAHLSALGHGGVKRTTERHLNEWLAFPPLLSPDDICDERGRPPNTLVFQWVIEHARQRRNLVLLARWHVLPSGTACLLANDLRGGRYWVNVDKAATQLAYASDHSRHAALEGTLAQLQQHIGKPVTVFPHGELTGWLRKQPGVPLDVDVPLYAYQPVQNLKPSEGPVLALTPHLKRLEAESIHIIREAVAEGQNPVMLYSLGKDSSVMLHLARKAFHPGVPPFPLLHVDTRWKFQEMYLFRDHMARHSGMALQVHINPDAIARDINPFHHGSALHTDITKTEGLKQALNQHSYDVIFGGARRDEEKSRAKERLFSFRTASHQWDPKQQRPELWSLYNTRKGPGESMRVFPLSNWTELDVWQYIHNERIPVVPLYFAQPRPVVRRNGMLLMVDDSRFRLLPGEQIELLPVRFRTLGCYPLTGAIKSTATTVADIILELIQARQSERQGRAIDSDACASMEKKKQEGYF
jgi:sulfate adenylyltransferase subunit 2